MSRRVEHEQSVAADLAALESGEDLRAQDRRRFSRRADDGLPRPALQQLEVAVAELRERVGSAQEIRAELVAAREVVAALRAASDAGLKISVMHGNRDFLLGADFATAAGVTLLADPCVLSTPEWQFVLSHGDALCVDDATYMAFRAQVRNPAWQAALLAKPLAERRAIAAHMREVSESSQRDKDNPYTDLQAAATEDFLRQHGYATFIHGHTHLPATHDHIVDGIHVERWVLADWHEELVVWWLVRRETLRREAERLRLAGEQARLEGLVEERTGELSELSNYLQTVREEERSRIARDLHDEMGGILVAAKMDVASAAKHVAASDPETGTRLARALKSIDEGIAVKRRITEDLRPTLLDNLGLSAALDWQVREVCDRAGLVSTLNLDEGGEPLPPDVAIALYRIVQEALTNVVKYAKAKNVTVDLVRSAGGVSLTFRDDGVGLPESAPASRLSHGIAGMRQRVRALNGEFRIEGAPGAGTTIEVHLPVAGV